MSDRFNSNTLRLDAIANGQHILAAAEAQWAALVPFGATPADRKALGDAIAKAIVMNDHLATLADERESLSGMRAELDDLSGPIAHRPAWSRRGRAPSTPWRRSSSSRSAPFR